MYGFCRSGAWQAWTRGLPIGCAVMTTIGMSLTFRSERSAVKNSHPVMRGKAEVEEDVEIGPAGARRSDPPDALEARP